MWTPDLVRAVRVDDVWCLYAGASVQVRVSGLQSLHMTIIDRTAARGIIAVSYMIRTIWTSM